MARIILVAALATLLAACASDPLARLLGSPGQPRKGEPELAAGLQQYENGRHADAARSLQSALYLGLTDPDAVRAHKHLAFIHCALGREDDCREEFRRALRLDPGFELAPAEAGHPRWGPVFRSVRAGR